MDKHSRESRDRSFSRNFLTEKKLSPSCFSIGLRFDGNISARNNADSDERCAADLQSWKAAVNVAARRNWLAVLGDSTDRRKETSQFQSTKLPVSKEVKIIFAKDKLHDNTRKTITEKNEDFHSSTISCTTTYPRKVITACGRTKNHTKAMKESTLQNVSKKIVKDSCYQGSSSKIPVSRVQTERHKIELLQGNAESPVEGLFSDDVNIQHKTESRNTTTCFENAENFTSCKKYINSSEDNSAKYTMYKIKYPELSILPSIVGLSPMILPCNTLNKSEPPYRCNDSILMKGACQVQHKAKSRKQLLPEMSSEHRTLHAASSVGSRDRKFPQMTNDHGNNFYIDKLSETTILQNVKRRLEKDLDNISFTYQNELDKSSSDLCSNSEWSLQSSIILRSNGVANEENNDVRFTLSEVKESRSMPAIRTMHRNIKQSCVYNSTSTKGQNEEQTLTPLPRFSARCIGFSSEFKSVSENSFSTRQSYSADTGVSCNYMSEIASSSREQELFPDYFLREGKDAVFTREDSDFLDESQVDCTIEYSRPCNENSVLKFSRSEGRLTTSLDSGILTEDNSFNLLNSREIYERNSEYKCSDGITYGLEEYDCFPAFDLHSIGTLSDSSLSRRIDEAVSKFTENLILCERRAKAKLMMRREDPGTYINFENERRYKKKVRKASSPLLERNETDPTCNLQLASPPWSSDDERLPDTSTFSLSSFSDSDINDS